MIFRALRLLPVMGLVYAFAAATSALAAPRSGEYKFVYMRLSMKSIKTSQITPDRMQVTASATMIALSANAGPLPAKLSGRCVGTATIDKAAETVESHGSCIYADRDGDKIYERYDYPQQPRGAYLEGTAQWTEGTGKFVGMASDLETIKTRAGAMTEGVLQVSGTKIVRYLSDREISSLN